MEKVDGPQVRSKIMSLLRVKGPSLPIHVAKETGLSVLFASAFLSELTSDREIKLSNMKVGGSPLYFLPGHEEQLDRYSHYLPGKEKEALMMLKEKKILEDVYLEPAIRVALRSIKDFAFPVVLNDDDKQRIFWRHLSLPEKEAQDIILKDFVRAEKKEVSREIVQVIEPIVELKPEIKAEEVNLDTPPQIKVEEPINKKIIDDPIKRIIVEESLLQVKEKPVKIKEKTEFANKILGFFEKEDIEILEEREWSKKDFYVIVRINSDIGKLRFFAVCKDKKRVTEDDLAAAIQKAQAFKLPAYFICTGALDKKAQIYLQEYSGLIGFRKI